MAVLFDMTHYRRGVASMHAARAWVQGVLWGIVLQLALPICTAGCECGWGSVPVFVV